VGHEPEGGLTPARTITCPDCGRVVTGGALVCEACHAIVHREAVGHLLERAKREDDAATARPVWAEALALLPAGTVQHRQVSDHIRELDAELHQRKRDAPVPRALAGLGAVGLLLWKFKFVLVGVASKAKFLLFGLTKAKTLLGMGASLGVYWLAWGWSFAIGVIVSIWVHEIGHVVAMKRHGLNPSAPMFIPGFGAYVRSDRVADTAGDRAEIGMAGPWAGLLPALGFWAAGAALDSDALLAIARVGAWINLLNLIPVWQLDGARAFEALSRGQRLTAAAVGLGAWAWSEDTWVLALAGLAAVRAFGRAPDVGHRGTLVSYCGAMLALAAVVALVQVQTPL